MRFLLIALFVVAADQLSKFFVILHMQPNQSIPIISNVFHLTYVKNPGAAFGILAGRTGIFVFITIIAVILIVIFYKHIPEGHTLLKVALSLQLGGAVGNLIDRIRLDGYVTDFLDFRIWPVFNLADTAIFLGIGLLFLDLVIISRGKEL